MRWPTLPADQVKAVVAGPTPGLAGDEHCDVIINGLGAHLPIHAGPGEMFAATSGRETHEQAHDNWQSTENRPS